MSVMFFYLYLLSVLNATSETDWAILEEMLLIRAESIGRLID